MKFRIILLGCFAFTQVISAQIKQETWEKGLAIVAKHANIISLKNAKISTSDLEKLEPKTPREVRKGLEKLEKNLELCDSIENFSYNHKKDDFTTVERAKRFLADTLLFTSAFEKYKFLKSIDKQKMSKNIRVELDNIPDSEWIIASVPIINNAANNLSNSNKRPNQPSAESFSGVKLIGLCILICVLLSLTVFYLLNRKLQSIKEKLSDRSHTDNDKLDNLKGRLKILETDFDRQKNRITDMQATIEQLQKNARTQTVAPTSYSAQPSPNLSPPSSQELYLSAPTGGSFASVAKEYKAGESIYLLKTFDGKRGRFSLINNRVVLNTVRISASEFIKPACQSENEITQNTQSIITEQEGVAIFDGGQWRIEKKAIIHYE